MSVTNGVVTALPAPDGYIVDFDHPQRQYESQLYWIYGIGQGFMLMFFGQHLFVRWFLQKKWKNPATYCLLAAWVMSVTCQSLVVSWFRMDAIGVHAWEMPIQRFIFFLKSFTCVAVTFNAIHCSAKMSLLLYYRVLSPQLWWKVSIYATMCLVCGYCVSLFFAQLLACRPVAASWDITITNYTCIDRQAVFRATAVFGIVSDLILLLLPIPLVAQLHMPLTQKLGVVLVFAIASATFVTSIVRITLLLQPSFSSPDQTWNMMLTVLWALVELNLLVICPSMCTLRAFIRHVAPRIMGNESDTSQTPRPNKASEPYRIGFRTIGEISSPRNKVDKYGAPFDHDDMDLSNIGHSEPTKVRIEALGFAERAGDLDPTWDNRVPSGSTDNVIIQTRTVTVTR